MIKKCSSGSTQVLFLFLTLIILLLSWKSIAWSLSCRKSSLIRNKIIYCHYEMIKKRELYLARMNQLNKLILSMRAIETTGAVSGGVTAGAAKIARIAAEHQQQVIHLNFIFLTIKNKEKTLPTCHFSNMENISPYITDIAIRLKRHLDTRTAMTNISGKKLMSLLKLSSARISYRMTNDSQKLQSTFYDDGDSWIF